MNLMQGLGVGGRRHTEGALSPGTAVPASVPVIRMGCRARERSRHSEEPGSCVPQGTVPALACDMALKQGPVLGGCNVMMCSICG